MAASGVEHIFFDCDDTLYRNNWATALKLNAKFGAYCSSNLGVPESQMMDLYKTHGTTLCGLIREGHLQEDQVQDFLNEVHDIPLQDDIQPDHELRAMLLAIPQHRWVFTAATREHAVRCLTHLGIQDCFEGIIACSSTEVFQKAGYVSKHDRRCFEFAMDAAGVPHDQAAKCMLLDDSASNLKTAKAIGWTTVLVGLHARNGSKVDNQNADTSVNAIHEIRSALPNLFVPSLVKAPKSISGVKHIFFDCDDTLYRNDWATAIKLNAKFGAYCSSNLGVPESKMMDLYKTHGTTLCGLIREGHLQEAQVQDFLNDVHDIALQDDIQPDLQLRAMLLAIPHRRWVFTAATREHAVRCLTRLGIQDCFEGIIACSSTEVFQKAGYVSKHDRRCFEFAMDAAGVPRDEANKCMLLDDSASNLKTAKAMGWSTVLVGLHARNGSKVDAQNADFSINTIHEIRTSLPDLFLASPLKSCQEGKIGQKLKEIKVKDATKAPMKRERVLKPLLSSPHRRVLRRVSTPLSPRSTMSITPRMSSASLMASALRL